MTIKLLRAAASVFTSGNPTLEAGQPAFETDTRKIKVGDGSTAWNSLGYLSAEAVASWDSITGKPSTFTPSAHNQAFSTITATPTTLAGYGITDAATSAQGALADSALQPGDTIPWTDVTGKPTLFDGAYSSLTGIPSTFAPSAHSHVIADVTGLQTALDGKQAAGSYAAASHTHAIADVTGLQGALDGKQPIATVLTNTTAAFTTAQETKLAGIAAGATANSADATLLSRANHTGTQLAATISDFSAAVAATPSVSANTAKVSNATHTGDVTGDTALTIAADAVTNAKLANMGANTIKGAVSAGDPVDLTPAQVRTMINVADGAQVNVATDLTYTAATRLLASSTGTDVTLPLFTSTDPGLVPLSGGGTSNFLRADGSWAAPAGGGGSSDPLDLATTAPAAPAANTVRLFRDPIANRQLLGVKGDTGIDTPLQPMFGTRMIGIWAPAGNSTTVPGLFGMAAMTVTGFTATARNVAATNLFTRTRRLGLVSAATAPSIGQFRAPTPQVTLGTGTLGGFFFLIRFGISDAATVAGARMFIGVGNSVAPTNVEPSTIVNCIGVGHGAADTNLKLFFGGSAAQTPIDLGANFPANTLSTDMYQLALYAPVNSTTCQWEVTRLNTGNVASGNLTGTAGTQIPASSTLLAVPWGYRTNNATALAVGLDVATVYVETDY